MKKLFLLFTFFFLFFNIEVSSEDTSPIKENFVEVFNIGEMMSHDDKFTLYFRTRDKAILAKGQEFNYITDYPTYLNLNMQKELKDDISICFNLTTGFSNSLTNSEKWKISTGLLFNRFKKTPITLGLSLGEQSEINSGFSIGRNIGPFSINYGLRLRDSFFLQSMKGMDSSLSIVFKVN